MSQPHRACNTKHLGVHAFTTCPHLLPAAPLCRALHSCAVCPPPQVEDLSAEPNYPFEPFHSNTHDNITTRWLDNTYAVGGGGWLVLWCGVGVRGAGGQGR